jgi:hypothetical protein
MTKLSENFTLEEMSATSKKLPNTPGIPEVVALVTLCLMLLEKIRGVLGRPVAVESGFRCVAVNRAVGGSDTSQHTKGQAADIRTKIMSNYELFLFIYKHRNILSFDQLIYEYDTNCCHISYVSEKSNRLQVMTRKVVSGKLVYADYI